MKIVMTQEKIDEAMRLRAAGVFVERIAGMIGVNVSTLKKRMQRMFREGFATRNKRPKTVYLTDAELEVVRRMTIEGYGRLRIADAIGGKESAVRLAMLKIAAELRLPRKRVGRHEIHEDTYTDDFAYAVYQYVATHEGCTADEVATATGYSLSRVVVELGRLSNGLGRLIEQRSGRWHRHNDVKAEGAMRGADARAMNLLKGAA